MAQEAAIGAVRPGVFYRDIHLLAGRTIAEGLKELGLMRGDIDEAVSQGAHALFFPHGIGHMMGLDVHDMEDLGETSVGYDRHTKRSTQFGLSALRMARKLRTGIRDDGGTRRLFHSGAHSPMAKREKIFIVHPLSPGEPIPRLRRHPHRGRCLGNRKRETSLSVRRSSDR